MRSKTKYILLFLKNKFYLFIYLFIYLFVCLFILAALGLHCCMWAFSSCCELGLLFVALRGFLIAVASPVAEHRHQVGASVVMAHGLSRCGSWPLEHRLSSCGARAQLFRGMWDLPGPGLEHVSPALAGGFFFFWQADSNHCTTREALYFLL